MKDILKENFDALKLKMTYKEFDELLKVTLLYELRDTHPLVLNSPYIGTEKVLFTEDDKNNLYDIFNIDVREVRDIIKRCEKINPSHNVSSNPFNVIITYLLHRISKTANHEKVFLALANYWQYMFFSSLVNRRFPHGANKDIMTLVIEDLNLKYDIKVYGTWKEVINHRSLYLDSRESIHRDTLDKYSVDDKIVYLMSDVQTRLRSQLNLITTLYYDYNKDNNKILSVSSTMNIDGETVLRESASGFNNVSNVVYNKVLNKNLFVNDKYIDLVLHFQKDISKGLLIRTLITMSDLAMSQRTDETTRKIVKKRDGSIYYMGIEGFTHEMLSTIYSKIAVDKSVKLNNKLSILVATRNIFTNSRSKEPGVLNTKSSIRQFLIDNKIASRDRTLSSVAIALPLYFVLMSFECL